jgi:hypothetical protein
VLRICKHTQLPLTVTLLVVHSLGNLARGSDDIKEHEFFSELNMDDLLQGKTVAPWLPRVSSPTDTGNFDAPDSHEHLDDGYADNGDWDRDF